MLDAAVDRRNQLNSMAFKKHVPTKIEIDPDSINHDSPEVVRRMERIETNFARFDELMTEVEAKLPQEPSSPNPKKPR